MINDEINIKFLQKNNLIKATLLGLFFWLLIFLFVPLKLKQEIGFLPFFYIFINYIAFLLGIKIISTIKKEKRVSFKLNKRLLAKVFWFFFTVALLGFLLKTFDKFYIRGVSLSYSMSYNRILLERAGASIISILSAVIAPFSFIPLFIYYTKNKKNILQYIFSLFLFFSPIFDFIMMGSRSGIFVILLMFALYLFYFKKLKLSFFKTFALFAILCIIAIYSTKLFIERTKDFAGTDKVAIEHMLKRSSYNFTITPTNATKTKIINSENKLLQAGRLTVINFAQYYLHGVFEFGYLYNNYKNNHYYGAYTFNIFVKFINIIFRTDINLEEIQNSPPRTGIYTTFFGPIFIDFGWLAFVFMFFFGAIQKTIYNKCLEGRFQFIPLLFYFLIINFFMPVFNFINGAQGLYIITTFVLFPIIFIFLTGRLFLAIKNNKKLYIKIFK